MEKFTKKTIFITTLVAMFVMFVVPAAFGQGRDFPESETKKRSQTGMKFLNFSVDARAAAMSNAVTAQDQMNSVALFYNPAGMGWQENAFHVSVGNTDWIADIDYNMATASFRPSTGEYGVFGISFLAVDYGEFFGTIRSDTDPKGFVDSGTFSPSAFAIGFGYAKAVTNRFSVGAQVKFVREDLKSSVIEFAEGGGAEDPSTWIEQDNRDSAIAFDFGVLYRTGFKSLNFAMTARNFAAEQRYAEENFELPLTFRVAILMDLVDFTKLDKNVHSLLFTIDTERPRDFSEQLTVGAEYTFMNTLALRAGYTSPTDEQGISLGAGLKRTFGGDVGFALDYSYTDFGVFNNVNRFTFQFMF